MAAASADRPAVVLPVGPMRVGHFKGEVLGACTDCRRLWGQYRAGTFSAADIERVSERLAPTKGTCMVMGTASTMGCIVETLAWPRQRLDRRRIPSPACRRRRQARRRDGEEAGPRPSEIMTAAAFRNALTVLQAIGGSTNALVHLTVAAPQRRHRAGGVRDRPQAPVLVDLASG
jgi:dihydroxy-acid dehydratase